jgi:hypothetical protein
MPEDARRGGILKAVEWKDPAEGAPPVGEASLAQRLEELKSRPGDWGIVGRWYTPQPAAKQLRELSRDDQAAGFDFTTREENDEYLLYGKWRGE